MNEELNDLQKLESPEHLKQSICREVFDCREIDGKENPAFAQPYIDLAVMVETIGYNAADSLWDRFGAEFGTEHNFHRVLWHPDMRLWAKLAWREASRLAKTSFWVIGHAGSGKTYESVTLVDKWVHQETERESTPRVWINTIANVCCEQLRDKLRDRGLNRLTKNVETLHTRFSLANADHKFEGAPTWWTTGAPNAGRTTQGWVLYIIDEAFFVDARTMALTMASIPTGAIVVFVGDADQNRPIDGTEFAHWLCETMTETVFIEGEDTASAAIWWALGKSDGMDTSAQLRRQIENVRVGKVPAFRLTKLHRFGDSVPGIVKAHKDLFSGEFPVEGPGLKITRAESDTKAVEHIVKKLMNKTEGWVCLTPTNPLAQKITAEYNRYGRIIMPGSVDFLYFQPGQRVQICVTSKKDGYASGLCGTLTGKWKRAESGKYGWFEVQLDAKPGEKWGRTIKVKYSAKHSPRSIVDKPISELREEFSEDVIDDMYRQAHEAACRGVLVSPYCLTNHRAQGSTVRRAMVFIPWNWKGACAEWLYVALSRAKLECEIIFADDPNLSKEDNDIRHEVLKTKLLRRRPHAPNPFAFTAHQNFIVDKGQAA